MDLLFLRGALLRGEVDLLRGEIDLFLIGGERSGERLGGDIVRITPPEGKARSYGIGAGGEISIPPGGTNISVSSTKPRGFSPPNPRGGDLLGGDLDRL